MSGRIKKIETSIFMRRWSYLPPGISGTSGPIEIESSVAGDGNVLIRPPRGTASFWIKNEDLEEFIDTLREAAKRTCTHCDGKGAV